VKKIAFVVSALALLMILAAVAPAFAKNMHLPPGAFDVIYMNGGGTAVVDIPSGSIPPVPTATKMLIGVHIDDAPAKYMGVRLYIELYEEFPQDSGTYSWQPWVEVTTNANTAKLMRDFWGGTATEFNLEAVTYYAELLKLQDPPVVIPPELLPYLTTDNVFPVSDQQLTANRHGNNILVNLAIPLQIKAPMTFADYWTLPAFSLKLDVYGSSVHREPQILVMSGWPGAWGGTLVVEEKGFNANGAFTCPAWSYNAMPMTEGWVTMQGKQTFYSPPQT